MRSLVVRRVLFRNTFGLYLFIEMRSNMVAIPPGEASISINPTSNQRLRTAKNESANATRGLDQIAVN